MLGIVNAFVHGFMYLYYFLSALNPQLSRSVWKKRITQIQLVTIMGFSSKLLILFETHFSSNLLFSWFIFRAEHLRKIVTTPSSGCGLWSFRMSLCWHFSVIFITKHTSKRNKTEMEMTDHLTNYRIGQDQQISSFFSNRFPINEQWTIHKMLIFKVDQ